MLAAMDLKPVAAPGGQGVFSARSEALPGVLSLPWIVGWYFAFRPALVVVAARGFGEDPQAGTAMSLVLNFLLLGLIAFQAIGIEPRTEVRPFGSACGRWVLLFLALSGCSLLWTVAVSAGAAVAFWCGMAADVAIVVMLIRVHGPVRTALSLVDGYLVGACCFALLGWILPAQSDLRLGDEEYLGSNQFGFVCAFAIMLGQYVERLRTVPRNWYRIAVAAFLALTLLRTLSKTTIIAFLAAEGFLLVRDSSISRKSKTIVILCGAVALALSWGLLAAYYEIYINAGNQAETLTGRLDLWTIFVAESLDRPWFGHGFHSVWKVIPPFGPDNFEPRHAHNELLQQFYAYGAAGVVTLVGIYTSFFCRVRQLIPSPLRTALLSLLIFVLVRGLADTDPFDLSLSLSLMVLISATVGELRLQSASEAARAPTGPMPGEPAAEASTA
jgi:exopolysaccharide production protein ExoQ